MPVMRSKAIVSVPGRSVLRRVKESRWFWEVVLFVFSGIGGVLRCVTGWNAESGIVLLS